MEIGEIHLLFIIAVSLVLGVLIGFVITTLLIQRENKGLNNELDNTGQTKTRRPKQQKENINVHDSSKH